MKKTTMVTLEVELSNGKSREQDFKIEHAERILKMSKNGGWKLPEKSPYTFDKVNGIDKRPNTKPPKKSEE